MLKVDKPKIWGYYSRNAKKELDDLERSFLSILSMLSILSNSCNQIGLIKIKIALLQLVGVKNQKVKMQISIK